MASKNVAIDVDISDDDRAFFNQLKNMDGKRLKVGFQFTFPKSETLTKFEALVTKLESKRGLDFKINVDASDALQKLKDLKKELDGLNNVNIRVSYGGAGGRAGGSGGGGGSALDDAISKVQRDTAAHLKEYASSLKSLHAADLASQKRYLADKEKAELAYVNALQAQAAGQVAAFQAKQRLQAQEKLATEKAQAAATAFGGSFDGTLSKVLAKQEVQKRRVNNALREFNETSGGADLRAVFFGGKGAREAQRQRVADKIADSRGLNDNARAAFFEQARSQKLPALFDINRLKKGEALQQLAFAGIYGGLPSAALGGLLGATPLKGAGVEIGSTIAQVGTHLIEAPLRIFEEVSQKIKETALTFESSVVGISAALSQATDTFDAFGNRVTSVPLNLQASESAARQLQLATRPVLSRLGVAGAAEGNVVQSLQTGFLQRGINFTPEEFKKVAAGIVGGVVAKNPEFFQNESQAARDLLDISAGASTAKRTQAGILIGKETTGRIGTGTKEEILRAVGTLEPFFTAATESTNPAVLQRRFQSGVDNLEQTAGGEFLTAQKAAFTELADELAKPETIQAAKELGKALGEASSTFLRFSVSAVKVGAGIVTFIDNNKTLIASFVELGAAIAAINTVMKVSVAIEQARTVAIEKESAVNAAASGAGGLGLGSGFLRSGAGGALSGGLGRVASLAARGGPLAAAVGITTFGVISELTNRENAKRDELEARDSSVADIVAQAQVSSRQSTKENKFKSFLSDLGLAEKAEQFSSDSKNNPLFQLRRIGDKIASGEVSSTDRGFLEFQRSEANKELLSLRVAGVDQGTFEGQLEANALEQSSLREQLESARNARKADEENLAKARGEIGDKRLTAAQQIAAAEANIGKDGSLGKALNTAQLNFARAQQVNQSRSRLGAGFFGSGLTAASEKFLNNPLFSLPGQALRPVAPFLESVLGQKGIDAFGDKGDLQKAQAELDKAKRDVIEEQSRIAGLKKNAKSIDAGLLAKEEASLEEKRLKEAAAEQAVRSAERNKVGIAQQETQALLQGVDESTLLGRSRGLDIRLGGNKKASDALAKLGLGTDTDKAKFAAFLRERSGLELEKRQQELGLFGLEQEGSLIDRGNIPGKLAFAQNRFDIAGIQKRSADERLAALSSKGVLTSDEQQEQQRLQLQSRRAGVDQGIARREQTQGLIDKKQTELSFQSSLDSITESIRREKSEVDNITIAMRESKNALKEFKASLDEASAGQEEKVLGAAKEFVSAGGDQSKLPEFLRQGLANEDQFKQRFAGAKLQGILRDSFGIDDPTLAAGPSLGIPGFSPFARRQQDSQRKLENDLDLNSNNVDLFQRNLSNQRTGFELQRQRTSIELGKDLPGVGNSFSDTVLSPAVDAALKRNYTAPSPGDSLLGNSTAPTTAAGQKFQGSKTFLDTEKKTDKVTGPISKIDSADMDAFAAKVAATIAAVLMAGTVSSGGGF